ncbi:PP2C family protein-serine/threonine phosphatase [Candidatus Contubernalis alkaliaceticus]|uniref:PP2C family protein-serine/threonine phosphatase n=1 Tax=Candidatus Contubernalis alkaliaceticus TaxID=338645 RepID=UPI001F4BF58B|nr:protein phosphatase 2C domain-containing protein [Candidatus Contubernalis alkalaceticus]UNC91456.1 serine/threonine-protein phosphatase [Candidatus Contubernalis alkalaceticus]
MVLWFKRKKKNKQKQKIPKTISVAANNSFKPVPYNCQHVGFRENQEDAFAFSDLENLELVDKKGVLAVVADGMGGLSLGEEASRVAVQTFLREFTLKDRHEPVSHCLERALKVANNSVFDLAYQDGLELDIGTTLIAAVIFKDELHWISVGDSRIYHFRQGRLTQLTRDHIFMNQLIEDVNNGKITRSEAENHPEGSFLTSYLGLPEIPEIDRSNGPLIMAPGDAVLLCSDGLYNTLSNEEIAAVFKNTKWNIAEELVREALLKNKRHQDNITVVVLFCQAVESNN